MASANGTRAENRDEEVFHSSLPEDVDALHDYLSVLHQLMDEKARLLGESWEAELASQSEMEALLLLEEEISGRIANARSASFADVLSKFQVWDMLMDADGGADDASPRDEVIRSIRRDMEELLAAGRMTGS
jgi:hypothetical protein